HRRHDLGLTEYNTHLFLVVAVGPEEADMRVRQVGVFRVYKRTDAFDECVDDPVAKVGRGFEPIDRVIAHDLDEAGWRIGAGHDTTFNLRRPFSRANSARTVSRCPSRAMDRFRISCMASAADTSGRRPARYLPAIIAGV